MRRGSRAEGFMLGGSQFNYLELLVSFVRAKMSQLLAGIPKPTQKLLDVLVRRWRHEQADDWQYLTLPEVC